MRVQFGSFLLLALIAALVPARPDTLPEDSVLERFPMSVEGEPLLVPVTIGDKTYPFFIGSGCTHCAYDTTLLPQLGQPLGKFDIETDHANLEAAAHSSPEGRIGKLPLPRSKVPVVDLAKARAVAGIDFFGIVGMDFLRSYALRIDPDRGEMALLRGGAKTRGECLPLRLVTGLPVLDIGVIGQGPPGQFYIDTGMMGFSSVHLDENQFRLLELMGRLVKTHGCLYQSMGGNDRIHQGHLDELRLGSFVHSALMVGSAKESLLALPFWLRYKVTFDFPAGKIYLEKSKYFDRPDLVDRSGLHFLRSGNRTVVVEVDAGSPAIRAGIHQGDVLLQIDEMPANSGSLIVLRNRLCRAGKKVALRVEREGKTRDVVVELPK